MKINVLTEYWSIDNNQYLYIAMWFGQYSCVLHRVIFFHH